MAACMWRNYPYSFESGRVKVFYLYKYLQDKNIFGILESRDFAETVIYKYSIQGTHFFKDFAPKKIHMHF